jgi:uncharacterized protein (TIGR03067 family)
LIVPNIRSGFGRFRSAFAPSEEFAMNRILLAGSVLTVFLILCGSSLWPQDAPVKAPAGGNPIEGGWTLVCSEVEGKVVSQLPSFSGATLPRGAPGGGAVPYLWKISRERIETGPDNHLFPQGRFSYELNPGKQAGAMDWVPLDKEGGKIVAEKQRAIFFVKDDYLLVCSSQDGATARPEKFSTSSAPRTVLYVLRRTNLK